MVIILRMICEYLLKNNKIIIPFKDLNLKLKRYCEGNNFLFVDSVNVEESCLNNSKLYLNRKEQIFYVKTSKILFTIIEVQ